MRDHVECAEEDVELRLACQGYLYELFRVLLGTEPNEELLERLTDGQASQALRLAARAYDSRAQAVAGGGEQLDMLAAVLDGWEGQTLLLESLRTQYVRYLAGPMKGDAQPWESVYTSHRHLLFQETTLRVRDFYRSFGCIPEMYPHVADDHVALECGFMAVLCRRALKALEEGDQGELAASMEGQRLFLRDHLLAWVPAFAERISERSGDSVYQLAVRALAELCRVDGALLARDWAA